MIINLTNISIINDGTMKRLTFTWEELNDEGKTITTNKHESRIITDKEILKNVTNIEDYIKNIIEEG